MPMPREKGKGRTTGARPFGCGARNGQSFNSQWQNNFNGQQFVAQYPFTEGQPANPRCQKCGGERHANVLLCPEKQQNVYVLRASDTLPKFVDSPGYSRHNGAIWRQKRQDALAMHTRCP